MLKTKELIRESRFNACSFYAIVFAPSFLPEFVRKVQTIQTAFFISLAISNDCFVKPPPFFTRLKQFQMSI